jgi:hypothetical protein
MPRNVKKFCRLSKYLQQTDKDLYQVFDDLCLFSLFSKRGGRGITFLYPSSKSYRKKIIDLAYSNTPEKAVEIIKTLVLMDHLSSTDDFEKKKDDIPNSLRKKLEVDSADSKEVNLKGGFKLVDEKKYVKLYSNDNTAVYLLSGSGELPTSGTQSSMKYVQETVPAHTKGGANRPNKLILEQFLSKKYCSGEGVKNQHTYKIAVGVLCKFASDKDSDYKKRIYSGLCASYKASYYNLVNPYGADVYNIGDAFKILYTVIEGWESIPNEINAFDQAINEFISSMQLAMKIDAANEVAKNITEQKNIIDNCSNCTEYITKVKAAYNGDDNALYKDLLTVYCYLATIKDDVESYKDYHMHCFIPVMKNLFSDRNYLLKNKSDLANTYTLYGNLVKSDAFKYVPKTYHNASYEIIVGLPDPNNKAVRFSIQFNELMIKRGGGDDDTGLMAFMGGIGASHAGLLSGGEMNDM